ELWHEKLDKAEKLTSATRDVGPIQAKAVAAQQARDALIAGRDQQIMKAVNEPPKSPDEQEPPVDPPDRPVDAEKGPADATPPSQRSRTPSRSSGTSLIGTSSPTDLLHRRPNSATSARCSPAGTTVRRAAGSCCPS